MNKAILSIFGVFCASSLALAQGVQSEDKAVSFEEGMTYSGPTDPPRYQAQLQQKDRATSQREKQTGQKSQEPAAVPLRDYNSGQVFGEQ